MWFVKTEKRLVFLNWQLFESPSAHVPLFVRFAEGVSVYIHALKNAAISAAFFKEGLWYEPKILLQPKIREVFRRFN